MRAVNLLPSDLRGAAPKPARVAGPEPVQGIGAYVVLGVLALCVAAFAAYILTTNGIKQREADLEAATQRTTAASAKAAALKPYADFQALASTRVETVRGLAAARFDWERALRDISHAVPGNVTLSSLTGDMGLPGTEGNGGDPLRASISAPAITMTGCAPTQTGVARMMARIKAVDGVTRVSLSKSEAAAATAATTATTGAASCKGDAPATFSLVVFFEKAKALDAYGSSGAAAASASVPVPNAVNQANGAAGTTPADTAAPAGSDTGSAPAGTDAPAAQEPQASASTTTSPTTGSTP